MSCTIINLLYRQNIFCVKICFSRKNYSIDLDFLILKCNFLRKENEGQFQYQWSVFAVLLYKKILLLKINDPINRDGSSNRSSCASKSNDSP